MVILNPMENVVVTGVSTGIGWGITKILIQRGFRVFGSVRKQSDADRLTAEFGEAFIPVLFDVTDEAAVQAGAAEVRRKLSGQTLWGLVNNAGIAVPAPLALLPIQEFRRQIEVNLTGCLIVTQAFLPLLGADRSLQGKPGRIVNISSVAGKRGGPFLGAYVASKHAIEGLSESLRRELMLYGIDVIVVGPGAVATPIWDKAEQAGTAAYAQSDYADALGRVQNYMLASGRKGYPPEKIGSVVYQALTKRKPRLRYAVVPGSKLGQFIENLLPRRVIDRILAKNLGFK